MVKDFFTESTDPPADPHINSEELFGSLGEDAAGIAQAAIFFARKRLAGYHLTTFEPSIRHGIGVGDYTDKNVLGFSAPHLQCRDSAPSPALAVAQGEPSRVSSPAR